MIGGVGHFSENQKINKNKKQQSKSQTAQHTTATRNSQQVQSTNQTATRLRIIQTGNLNRKINLHRQTSPSVIHV